MWQVSTVLFLKPCSFRDVISLFMSTRMRHQAVAGIMGPKQHPRWWDSLCGTRICDHACPVCGGHPYGGDCVIEGKSWKHHIHIHILGGGRREKKGWNSEQSPRPLSNLSLLNSLKPHMAVSHWPQLSHVHSPGCRGSSERWSFSSMPCSSGQRGFS